MKRTALLAFAALVSLAALVAACGGVSTTSPSPSSSTWTASMFGKHEYGFSIKYPTGYTKVELPSGSGKAGEPLYHVVFVDPKGAKAGDKSLDMLEVGVYQMTGSPKPADFKKHKKDFEGMLAQLIGTPPDLHVAEGPTWTTVAGQPAVMETYTYTTGGVDVAATATLVFKGDRAYYVRAQAARTTWPTTGRTLESAIATLSLS